MRDYDLSNYCTITCVSDVVSRMFWLTKSEFSIEDVNPDTVLFVSMNGQSSRTYNDKAVFAWADTGKEVNGHKIFISMKKSRQYAVRMIVCRYI